MTRSSFAILMLLTAAIPATVSAFAPTDVNVLLTSMNAARRSNHVQPLALDQRLCRIAYAHALDMERRSYFAHTSPEGLTPFQRMAASKYRFRYAGENLAIDSDANGIFRDLWVSREHRSIMLGAHYARVGIASVPASAGTLVVEDFSD